MANDKEVKSLPRPPIPAIPDFTGVTSVYDEAAAFFASKGFKKRTLGAFVLENPGQQVVGVFQSIERRGPYASWLLRISSKDNKQALSLWVNDIVKDQLEGVPQGTEVGILFKGWVEGRNFNYRDYDIFVGELPKPTPKA